MTVPNNGTTNNNNKHIIILIFWMILVLSSTTTTTAEYPNVLFPWTPKEKEGTTTTAAAAVTTTTTTLSDNDNNSNVPYHVDCPEDGEHDYCGILEFCDGISDIDGSRVFGYRLPCIIDNDNDSDENCKCLGISGPLIRLQPGNKYKLTLRNVASSSYIMTNLHTHGLHIVGDGDSDDVTRMVSGSTTFTSATSDQEEEKDDEQQQQPNYNCLDYTWDIPNDHVGGTYWYHAHHHGTTEEQVQGGAYGMLIVEDNTNLNPNIPDWARNELLLQAVETFDGIIGNGKPIGEIEILSIQPNIWYRLRLSMVSSYAAPTNITFLDGVNNNSDDGNYSNVVCDIHKVANDGVWRSSIPGPKATRYELTGVSRADFALRCNIVTSLSSSSSSSSSSSITIEQDNGIVVEEESLGSNDVPITYTWYGEDQHFASLRLIADSVVVDVFAGDDGDDTSSTGNVVAKQPDYSIMSEWTPTRPYALQDMRNVEITNPNNTFTVFMRYDNINDVYWDPTTPLTTIGYDRVHEWTLQGTSFHPFHIHLYHVQVMNEGCGAGYEIGEFYDTIAKTSSESDGPCIVRFRTADIGQRCVIHCHVLFHEDNGSMAWINVTDDLIDDEETSSSGADRIPMSRNTKSSDQYKCPALVRLSPSPTSSPTMTPVDTSSGAEKEDTKSGSSTRIITASGSFMAIMVAFLLCVHW